MAVVDFEITRRETYAGGQSFGDAGVYERIDGRVSYAVSPDHPLNQVIADLDRAPRAADGNVHFVGDVSLLRPVDPQLGARRLFVELPNRGRRLVPRNLHRAEGGPEPADEIPVGDGLLFQRGFTVATVGWQWDVFRSDKVLGIDPPYAGGVRGTNAIRFQPNTNATAKLLTDRSHRPLPTADVHDPDAQLLVRDWELGPASLIPRTEWEFARQEADTLVPDANQISFPAGFVPGKVYEIVYTTATAPVGGAGLIAIRDLTSFLRYDLVPDNPCAGTTDWAYGFGISQTGRILRRFVCLGMNLDESQRQVFDGLMPHVAGARQGDYNCRFGQPGNAVQATPNFGSYYPYTDEAIPDSFTEASSGLLSRQRALGGMPKIFWTNTSAEYWRGDGYLLHIDPDGTEDLAPSPETRIYSFAGTQHGAGSVPTTNIDPNNGTKGRYPFNVVDHTPLIRAAIINLDRWVADGVEPPTSYHPRLDDGTAIGYEEATAKFPAMRGFVYPNVDHFRRMPRVNLGPESQRGINAIPPELGPAFTPLVWSIDADGNEAAPIRLPDLAVPVGTHTGWNPRHPEIGGEDQLMPMRGFTNFFPSTEAERKRSGDARRSVSERYADRADYLNRVRSVVEELVRARHLLADDVESVIADAGRRYDTAMQHGDQSEGE